MLCSSARVVVGRAFLREKKKSDQNQSSKFERPDRFVVEIGTAKELAVYTEGGRTFFSADTCRARDNFSSTTGSGKKKKKLFSSPHADGAVGPSDEIDVDRNIKF